jgi:hypothetical protein
MKSLNCNKTHLVGKIEVDARKKGVIFNNKGASVKK